MPTSWHTGSNIQTDDAYSSREEKRKASQPNANLKIKCKSVNYQSRKRCISLELRQMGKGNQNSIVCFENTHKKNSSSKSVPFVSIALPFRQWWGVSILFDVNTNKRNQTKNQVVRCTNHSFNDFDRKINQMSYLIHPHMRCRLGGTRAKETQRITTPMSY